MARKNTVVQESQTLFSLIREGSFIVIVALSLFFMLALLSYHRSDFIDSSMHLAAHVENAGGRIGAWFASVFLHAFGYLAFIFPSLIVYSAWLTFYKDNEDVYNTRLVFIRNIGILITLIGGCALLSQLFESNLLPSTPGGLLGKGVSKMMIISMGYTGSLLFLTALFLSGITFFAGVSWVGLAQHGSGVVTFIWNWFEGEYRRFCDVFRLMLDRREIHEPVKPEHMIEPSLRSDLNKNHERPLPATSAAQASSKKPEAVSIRMPKAETPAKLLKRIKALDSKKTPTPPIDLLDPPELELNPGYQPETLQIMSEEVEKRLNDFGVEARVVAVHPGPVITRFELELAPGVKVSKITSLVKDLARSLSVISVRVVEVIPGKSVIGIELPNEKREVVRLSEVIASDEYQHCKAQLPLALGKDISGQPQVVDLSRMPHLLVAGTTGSGKSVGLNAMILSLLFHHTPQDLKLIMIDPKMLELSIYDDIPHLLAPVVTDMKEAANALRWCVAEMERRYRLMAACGVRNLAGFNKKVKEAYDSGEPILDPLIPESGNPEELKPLPFVVVVIDEFADMMMVVGKKVEQLIARIAQKARAAGIHMILATQRPSVDVITGLIKSNIPTRIAFQVSSKVDSRTILDQQGAEQLLGHGDMLYLPAGMGTPNRIHGAFVADHEVHAVAAAWKQRGKPEYEEAITEGVESADLTQFGLQEDSDSENDSLYDDAVFFVTQTRKVSISSVQRRFKIGYNRAARLVEQMEAQGVVSAMETNGQREVLAPPPVES